MRIQALFLFAALLLASSLRAQVYEIGDRTSSTLTVAASIIADGPFAGTVSLHGSSAGTGGKILADGRSLNRDDYPDLFNAIGTTYGSSSSTTFSVPNLIGRTVLGTTTNLGGTGANSINLRYAVSLFGVFPTLAASWESGLSPPVIGQIIATTAQTLPSGWVDADGSLLSISENETLFQLIGTTYGGDGENTFALPNLVGRAPIGQINYMGAETSDTLEITFGVSLAGLYPSETYVDDTYLGEIGMFASSLMMDDLAYAQGQFVSISQNTALFALLGTSYGGNGETTFKLPDLRGVTFNAAGTIPEPSSFALWAGALALCGAVTARRRR